MAKNEEVIPAIFDAVDDVNQQLAKEDRLEKSIHTALFGASSSLDSLGFVNLIAAIEQKIEEVFGISLTLLDERAMSQKNNPFETIGALADYISSLLEKKR